MSYIADITSILLDEISIAEKMLMYSTDQALGEWFMNSALDEINKIEKHFTYYLEVTGIKEKALTDEAAEELYINIKSRIDRLKYRGDKWG